MAYPTIQEVRQANAAVDDNGYALLTLSRPLGPYLAWIAIRLRATPRHVNYLSLVLVFVVLVLAAAGGHTGLIAATALVFIWQIVDVTDGTMARALAIRDNFGGFVDYVTGMVPVPPISRSAPAPPASISLPSSPRSWSSPSPPYVLLDG